MNIGDVITVVAILGFVWFGLRAFGLLAAKENPEKVVGAEIQFAELDGFGPHPPEFPNGVIRGAVGRTYQVEFLEPVSIDGRVARTVSIFARHQGHPISGVRRHRFDIRAIGGELDTGQRFIALIRRA